MAGITLEKGKAIYTYGQPMNALHLITGGKVRVDYPGGYYLLGKGDVIGICEVCSEIHFLSYTVLESVSLITYPLSSISVLNDLLQQHADMARFFMLSACRQINTLKKRCSISEVGCSDLYRSLKDDWDSYNDICSRYRISPRKLEGLDALPAYLESENGDISENGFYLGLAHIYAGEYFKEFLRESAVSLGLIKQGGFDTQKIWANLDEQFKYQQQISGYYFNEAGNDLFDCFTSLYHKLDSHTAEHEQLLTLIERIIAQFQDKHILSAERFDYRVQQFRNHLTVSDETAVAKEADSPIPKELIGSLNTILDFAGEDLGIAEDFRQHVIAYRQKADRNSSDDDVCALRRVLTDEFYVLYTALFEQTLKQPDVPIPVWMFLYFGYVDEELAGAKNTLTLYQLVPKLKDTGSFGVYTFYHWLMAIFNGEKEPSRNEFDQDYTDFMHKQKMSGNITEQDLMQLEKNGMSKVNYELQNLFPAVNKITFGRVTTFCPLFIAENALRDLDSSLVTVAKVSKALETVRKIDYSAFYRPGLDMNHMDVMGKVPIHTECLPDIILMPNAGIRSAMWQEIEGKKRNTPCRMIFSIFHMEDVNTSFIRMTGEFRWELCKRIQGGRWNDISEPSLTSEYFDYIQFYKKNHDLSTEAKERVRTGLMQVKNSFKEMFVRDYISWILFEGNASPRLNKVARKILFTHCPFSAQVCELLSQNPLYSELLQRHKIKRAQQLHQLKMLRQKLQNSNTPVPETLERECEYYTL